jgi:hypothetical protein
MGVTITSSTDPPSAVDAAATMYEGDQLVQSAGDSDEKPTHGTGGEINATRSVASTTDPIAAVEEAQEQIDQRQAEKREEYLNAPPPGLGKTRRKMAKQIERLDDIRTRQDGQLRERDTTIQELRARLERYEGAQNNGTGERQAAQQPQSQSQPTQEQLQQEYEEGLRELTAQASLPARQQLAAHKYPDLQETLNGCKAELPKPLLDELMKASDGYDIAYFLAKDKNLSQKVDAATKAGQIQEVNDILLFISKGLKNGALSIRQAQRPVSSAPGPIKPLSGGSAGRSTGAPPANYQDYKRWHDNKYGGK